MFSKFRYLRTPFFSSWWHQADLSPWSCPAYLEHSLMENCLPYHIVSALSSVGCSLLSGLGGHRVPASSAPFGCSWRVPVCYSRPEGIFGLCDISHSECLQAGILSTASKVVMLLISSRFYNILCKYFITKPCKIYFSSLLKESDITLLI